MAKKQTNSLDYYVYYDKKSGEILSVTKEKNSRYEYGLTIPYEEAENFLNGTWHFRDYVVGYKRLANNKTTLSVIPVDDQSFSFRNNVFEWITETKKDTDLVVEWNGLKKEWRFYLGNKFKEKFEDNIFTPKLVFFVTLETDLDFLIRTIYVDMQDLVNRDSVVVPFDSNIENSIDKISIGSKLVFKSYGLKVIHE